MGGITTHGGTGEGEGEESEEEKEERAERVVGVVVEKEERVSEREPIVLEVEHGVEGEETEILKRGLNGSLDTFVVRLLRVVVVVATAAAAAGITMEEVGTVEVRRAVADEGVGVVGVGVEEDEL